ncbi:MAG: hypothetical protein IT359_10780 [Gemmatimonadaceae bacterium]|nr:hypothetical protein [Gemmatimonadaceae bacterium]
MSMSPLVIRWRFVPPRALLRAVALVAATSLACRTDSIVSLSAAERNRRVTAHVGDQITITLQTIGPGEYASPPTISSPAVVFRDVSGCGTPVPAGPTQCFHFRAAAPGQALLTFAHTGTNALVQDTVDVR